ncbi:hypothetical protein D9M72_437680 [compost metagenome]
MGRDIDTKLMADDLRRFDPPLSADPGQDGEPAVAGEIERRGLLPIARENPCMRQSGPRPGGLLEMQFRVLCKGRFGLTVGDDRIRTIALVHLDTVGVELVDLGGDRLADGGALFFRCRRIAAAPIHVLLHLHRIDGIEQAERLEDRAELFNRLVGAADDLLGDRRSLRCVGIKQLFARLALQHKGEFPGKVEGILDRGVGAEPVRWRMAVRGIAHAEDASVRHRRRIHVVDRPGRDLLDRDVQILHADQVAHHLLRMGFVNGRCRLVDVVSPDDQPLVPGADHAHEAHADTADVGPRLQHPVEHRRTMGDITRQVGLKQDVH